MKLDKKLLTQLLYVLFAAAVIYVIYTYVIMKEGFDGQQSKIHTDKPPTVDDSQHKEQPVPDVAAPAKQILQNGQPSSLPYEIPLPPAKLINA